MKKCLVSFSFFRFYYYFDMCKYINCKENSNLGQIIVLNVYRLLFNGWVSSKKSLN